MKTIEFILDEEGNPQSFLDPTGEEWTIYMDYSDLYSGDRYYEYYSFNKYAIPLSEEFEEGEYQGYELLSLNSYDRHSNVINFYDYALGCSGELILDLSEDEGTLDGYFVIVSDWSNCDFEEGWSYAQITLDQNGEL